MRVSAVLLLPMAIGRNGVFLCGNSGMDGRGADTDHRVLCENAQNGPQAEAGILTAEAAVPVTGWPSERQITVRNSPAS